MTSDPETRRLIVITDEETAPFVSQVITNLDRPKPQVLIKVVFLEVTYRNSLDLGVEMGGLHSKNAAVQGAGTIASPRGRARPIPGVRGQESGIRKALL